MPSVKPPWMCLPASQTSEALALIIRTPSTLTQMCTTKNCWGQSYWCSSRHPPLSLPSLTAPLLSAERNRLCPPWGLHLQHGTLLLGICSQALKFRHPSTLVWTPSHPKRTKFQHQWTDNDWGIHLADKIAGTPSESSTAPTNVKTFHSNLEALHYLALTPPGTWQWLAEGKPFFRGSLNLRPQQLQYRRQYIPRQGTWNAYMPKSHLVGPNTVLRSRQLSQKLNANLPDAHCQTNETRLWLDGPRH